MSDPRITIDAVEGLRDALLMVDTYDTVEGNVVPPSELWAVVAAARKVLALLDGSTS